ncbi:MAG: hypothetical protein MJ252_06485 [archaeon]|nr:hypothetical protein [archaeon]
MESQPTKYVIAITKSKLYQFTGDNDFKALFEKYSTNTALIETSCKVFPTANEKGISRSMLQLLYNSNEELLSFGWMTESGYCIGDYDHGRFDPIQSFVLYPYVKIAKNGQKELDNCPIATCHTDNHAFVLYSDCIIVISKITSTIIHRVSLLKENYLNMEYDWYSNCLWIHTNRKLYQMKLDREDENVWQDYLEQGNYLKALEICESKGLPHSKKISKLYANYLFDVEHDYFNASIRYAFSDEKFEEVCLKFMMINEYEALKTYLQTISLQRVKNDYIVQKHILAVWFVEILLNQLNSSTTEIEIKRIKNELSGWMKDNQKYLDKQTIYELLQTYGRVEEFIEFAEIKNDFETIILHYINEKNIKAALTTLQNFLNRPKNSNQKEELKNIFTRYSHNFMKDEPEMTISLLETFKSDEIDLNKIISAIMSTEKTNYEKVINYLKTLVRDPKMKEKNIHNLYIFYLSKSEKLENKEELIEYLKKPLQKQLKSESRRKVPILFELEYAKKLFSNNYEALALVLALMGKYSDATKMALEHNAKDIAKYIAANVEDEKIKKNLWLQIFSASKNAQFNETLKIMDESKVLKIEDVLPCIMDNIKIEEFKEKISNCINVYEKNIDTLKIDIKNYNETAEQIKRDIYKVKKRSMEIQYKQCNCEICNKSIKDENVYLFPCGHMFDEKCIIEKLHEYGGFIPSVAEKMLKINDLREKIVKVENKKKEIAADDNKKDNKLLNFLNFTSNDKKQDKKYISNEELKQLEDMKKNLSDILSEECVLCGDCMVESTQYKFEGNKSDWMLA